MKKTLLTLGILGCLTLGLVACGDPDCNCTVSLEGETVQLFTDDNPTISEFDGECDEITPADLPGSYGESWGNINELGGSINCEED